MAALAVALVLALVLAGAAAPGAQASKRAYLRAANRGVNQTGRWWTRGFRWYRATLDGKNVASLWGSVPLFEAIAGLQIAAPSARHLKRLNRFAYGAERYLNPNLVPVPGFGPKPGQREPGKTTWFDDNGWWGMAYLDAYRATGNPRWLADARIAQQFISVSGWDGTPGRPGGIWWNTNQSFYAGESLAGGTLLSARLYALTGEQRYLDDAIKFINWADVWLTDPTTGLYARLRKPGTYPSPPPEPQPGLPTLPEKQAQTEQGRADQADAQALAANPDQAQKIAAAEPGPELLNKYPPFAPSPMPYVNGPMILAHRLICEETGIARYCDRARQLAATSIAVYQRFWMGPQFDFWYLRDMLEFAQRDTSADWAAIAASNARRALHRVRDKHGLYLRTWYGKKAHAAGGAPQGSLQLHAANSALFAWMAALSG